MKRGALADVLRAEPLLPRRRGSAGAAVRVPRGRVSLRVHHGGDARRQAAVPRARRDAPAREDHRDAGGRAGRHVRRGERREARDPRARRGETLFEKGSDEKDDALGSETSRTKTNASESFAKPHGSRPLRTIIAAASSAHEARQRERRAGRFGDAAAADAGGDVVARAGSGENGDDSRPADPPSSRASFADAEHAEDAALTSVALFCDVVERLLTYDPELRAQPGTALEHPFFAEIRVRAAGSRGLAAAASPTRRTSTTRCSCTAWRGRTRERSFLARSGE